ncbi:MAG: STAS domain-containing protein [Candidatus Viridilinea halotolerans]|uniref:STAS domain-containing protein n=1 Tax=Candidatus Viridilinea halotolerans TaxID=2491704 RepID=A0A426TVB9_9CHLR|nr:MAG: STAS domain-containing protein [Candidatus Viridilinea halotolerans]
MNVNLWRACRRGGRGNLVPPHFPFQQEATALPHGTMCVRIQRVHYESSQGGLMRKGHAWLDQQRLHDPLRREQALLVQNVLYVAMVMGALAAFAAFSASSLADRVTIFATAVLMELFFVVALVILRRGALVMAVIVANVSITVGTLITMTPTGLEGSRAILLMLVTPILLGGLIVSTRMLWINTALVILSVVGLLALEGLMPGLVGFSAESYDPLLTVIAFAIFITFIALVIDRFGQALRASITHLRHREHELEQLRDSLEQQVKERTTDLSQALHEMAAQSAAQAQLLAQIEAQQLVIRQLSVPLLPVGAKTLVMPLVGALDTERMQAVQQEALNAIERQHTSRLLLDLTGVPVIDTTIAQGLFKVVQAARLLGNNVVLIGIRPEVAQTMVALGINFAEIPVARDLASALATS